MQIRHPLMPWDLEHLLRFQWSSKVVLMSDTGLELKGGLFRVNQVSVDHAYNVRHGSLTQSELFACTSPHLFRCSERKMAEYRRARKSSCEFHEMLINGIFHNRFIWMALRVSSITGFLAHLASVALMNSGSTTYSSRTSPRTTWVLILSFWPKRGRQRLIRRRGMR